MIYSIYGYGKFKTEGSIGMAIRALANKHSVLFAQFLKNGISSELDFFRKIDYTNLGHLQAMNTHTEGFDITVGDKCRCKTMLRQIINFIKENNYSLIILDELLVCYDIDIIDKEDINQLIKECKQYNIDLCMTGRLSSKDKRMFINSVSDIASNNKCEKHCFNTYCTKCGRDYLYHYKFCPQCGRKLNQSSPPKKGRDY